MPINHSIYQLATKFNTKCWKGVLFICRHISLVFTRNLNAAIGSYYDYEQHTDLVPLPSMSFVKDVTIGEGESVRPNVDFVKTWKIRNTGELL